MFKCISISENGVWNSNSNTFSSCASHSVAPALLICYMLAMRRAERNHSLPFPSFCFFLPISPAQVLVSKISKGRLRKWMWSAPSETCLWFPLQEFRWGCCHAEMCICVPEERREENDLLLLSSSFFIFVRKASTPPFRACTEKSFEQTGYQMYYVLRECTSCLWFVSCHLF